MMTARAVHPRDVFAIALAGAWLLLTPLSHALEIVRDGEAKATIVVPGKADEVATRAAQWVHEYVRKASGVELAILPETKALPGNLISVGHTRLARAAGIRTDDLKWDGCKLIVKDRVLYLIGRDTWTALRRQRWRRGEKQSSEVECGAQGTCKAATTFLEDFCGVRWFLPVPDGELVPTRADLSVPDDTNITVTPAFAFLHGRYVYGSQRGPAAIANSNRTAIKLCTFGGHSWPAWMPPVAYHQAHPEYFAVANGARTKSSGAHLCTSNPEVQQALLRETRSLFDAGFEWVQLGQSDGYRRCQCRACEMWDTYRGRRSALGLSTDEWLYTYLQQNPCERIHEVHKWIADECQRSHPGKTVHLLVYSSTVMPSKRFDRWPPNTVGEVCDIDPRVIAAWDGKLRAKTTYMCWFLIAWRGVGFGVMVTPGQIAERIQYLREHNFIGIYLCGGGGNWGLQGPTYYTMGKMVEDPTRQYRDLIEEYCRGVYGSASEKMIDFFNLLYTRESSILMHNYFNRDDATPGERLTSMYPPDLLARLDRMLRAAEAEADTERARNWVRLTRDHFDFVKLCCHVVTAYRAYQAHPTDANLLEVERRVDAFEAYRARIVSYDGAHTQRWFPAYMKLYNFLTADGDYQTARSRRGRHRAERIAKGFRGTAVGFRNFVIREPFTWDSAIVKAYPFLRKSPTPDSERCQAGLAALSATAEQLATNVSFEDAAEDTMPAGWHPWVKYGVGSMASVEGQARTGNTCVLYEGMKRGGVHRRIAVEPGAYAAVAFVRAPEPLNGRAKLTVQISGRAEDGTVLRRLSRSTDDLPTNGWVALSTYGTLPAKVGGRDLSRALLILTVDNMAPDEKLYVDDLMLFRLEK